MSEEDIIRIAQKVIELQNANSTGKVVATNRTAEITKKYHKQLHEKFGSTSTIETAVRMVACYMAGKRTVAELSIEKYYECMGTMDELFARICGTERQG